MGEELSKHTDNLVTRYSPIDSNPAEDRLCQLMGMLNKAKAEDWMPEKEYAFIPEKKSYPKIHKISQSLVEVAQFWKQFPEPHQTFCSKPTVLHPGHYPSVNKIDEIKKKKHWIVHKHRPGLQAMQHVLQIRDEPVPPTDFINEDGHWAIMYLMQSYSPTVS